MADDEDDERAQAVKEKLKEAGGDRKDFTVYDMPTDLANKYISMAKLYYDNEVWRVLEHGMELMVEEHTTKVEDLEDRIDRLEAKVSVLESTSSPDDHTDDDADFDLKPTFGGDEPDVDTNGNVDDDVLEDLDELR